VKERLPKNYKKQSKAISLAIIEESKKHSMDPLFVMAVIAGESSFNPKAQGPVGEIGLMQLRPSTGDWMAQKMKLSKKQMKKLSDPLYNIKLGCAYLAWLREKFEGHGQLYVAAYNMGPRNVERAVGKNIYPKDYPLHVMKRYFALYEELGKSKI
jgi:soluble lytic murein transglycosylase